MELWHLAVLALVMAALLTYRYREDISSSEACAGPKLPPGPKPLPLLGNLLHLPPKGQPEFQHWLKHKEAHGPISSVTVLGQTIILLHSREAVEYVLQKKSSKTSSRLQTEFGYRCCGFDKILVIQDFDDRWRMGRKMVHQQLGSKSLVARHHDALEVEARRFLLRTLNEPERLIAHLRAQAGAVILNFTYGYSMGAATTTDPLVGLIGSMARDITAAFVPLAWPVDILPALRWLPEGLPGSEFKATARRMREINQQVANVPYSFVQQQMRSGNHRSSYVSRLLERSEREGTEDEEAIKWTAATLYVAGSDTVASSLSSFVLAMVLFPDVQTKAQEEIDAVIGTDRLPQMEDRSKLPYLEALVMEVHRWATVAPLGMPHLAEDDFTYNGHRIPKGAVLVPAIWGLCHDPELHGDPDSFKPERYLGQGGEGEFDPKTVAFGFGRRVCPGKHFADATIFIVAAQTLAAFRIGKAVDEQGVELEARYEATPTLVNHPKEFPYSIAPRSARHAELIRRIETERPWEASDAGLLKGLSG